MELILMEWGAQFDQELKLYGSIFLRIVNLQQKKILFLGIYKFVTLELMFSQGGSGNPYTGSRNVTNED